VFLRCVVDLRICIVCVCSWHVLYVFKFVFRICALECMCLNLSSEFVLWNSSWTKCLIEAKELLCSILHPSITIRGIMIPNSPCQPPWLTWNFWMSTQWQLVGFYVSMTSSQTVSENIQIHQHQHGTYLPLIPLMNFNIGARTWNHFLLL